MSELKRVDFFKANRNLSERVVEFMRCRVWKKAIQLEFDSKIQAAKATIENYAKLEGSIMKEHAEEVRIAGLAQIAEFEKQRDEQIEAEAKFEFTEADKTFKKSLKSADGAADLIADAVCEWFENYGLDISDTYFLDEILNQFGSKFDFRKFVATNAQDARALDVTRALEMMYCTAYTHMISAGTIKAAQIPQIVQDKYAPKKKKSSKKSAKKEDNK